MTGYGSARLQEERFSAAVEIRSVNNRYLKVGVKCSDSYAQLEPEIERLVRESATRGTINVSIRTTRLPSEDDFRLNAIALKSYFGQVSRLQQELSGQGSAISLAELAALPGVVQNDNDLARDTTGEMDRIRTLLAQALQEFTRFRQREGESMERDLRANVDVLRKSLELVTQRSPQVVSEFRDRLLERVRQVIADAGVSLQPGDIIREVSIFSERTDINEEIARLSCHIDQFLAFFEAREPMGRKLDFLSQEMNREVNTIGSKANDVTIAHAVVDMKTAIDRIREVLQNVE